MDAGNAEHNREKKINLDEVFFKEGEQICEEKMQEHRNTLENFI